MKGKLLFQDAFMYRNIYMATRDKQLLKRLRMQKRREGDRLLYFFFLPVCLLSCINMTLNGNLLL